MFQTAMVVPLGLVMVGASAQTSVPQASTAAWTGQVRDAGVRVSARIAAETAAVEPGWAAGTLPAGRTLELRLNLQDDEASQPLRGIRPRAWLARLTADPPEPCADQVRRFVSGRFVARADRDLNGWQVVTLNGDASVSIINPQLNVGATRLESLITLPGSPAEAVHLPSRDLLVVTIPDKGLVAWVDLAGFRVVHRVNVGGAPRRIVASSDERRVFVAVDGSPRLVVIGVPDAAVLSEVDIGDGLHGLALAAGGQRLIATSSTSGTVTVIRTDDASVIARHTVGGTPLPVTFSPLSGMAYVARVNEPRLAVVDPATGQLGTDIEFSPRITALRSDASGRWIFGVDAKANRVVVLDAGRGRMAGTTETVEQPDQVVFTRRFAYVRGLSSLSVTLVDLEALGRGELAATQVPMYQKRPDAAPGEVGVADMIAALPDGAGVLVGNGADTALYAYMEGMQAPQGTYRTYSRAARGVLVVDRSMREVSAGEFMNRFRFDRGGRYSLAVLVDQPRVVRCFDLIVDDSGLTATGARIALQHQTPENASLVADQPVRLRVRLSNADTREPLSGIEDLQLMVLEMPGISQQRRFMREVEPGLYEVEQRFPRPGAWRLMAQIGSRGLAFERAPTLDLQIRPTSNGSTPQ